MQKKRLRNHGHEAAAGSHYSWETLSENRHTKIEIEKWKHLNEEYAARRSYSVNKRLD